MAHYLVTGGCGFIGSHLCEELLARGHRVRVLDNLSTGSRANLAPGAKLMVGSVTDQHAVEAALAGVDSCFHLAAIASVERCNLAWVETHQTNVTGMLVVLEAVRSRASKHGGAPAIPVVYASSAAVYGVPEICPLPENAALRPISAYGADKLGCELHARVAGQVHGLPTTGLRFFNVFGPRQDPKSPYSGVISIFCQRVSDGQPVTINGNGRQTRDFVHVSDVVAALIAGQDAATTAAPVFNICTGQPTSVLQLATMISRICGQSLTIQNSPVRMGDIQHSLGVPLRSRQALRLGPPLALEEGLRSVIAWIRAGAPCINGSKWAKPRDGRPDGARRQEANAGVDRPRSDQPREGRLSQARDQSPTQPAAKDQVRALR